MGCDIRFIVNGEDHNIVIKNTSLKYNDVDMKSIVEQLLQHSDVHELLIEELLYKSNPREITEEEIQRGGIVHNRTISSLTKKYSLFDWSIVDQSTKIFATSKFLYYGKSLMRCIIELTSNNGTKERIFIVDPNNKFQVEELNTFLRAEALINKTPTEELPNYSQLVIALDGLSKFIEKIKPDFEEYEKIKDSTNNKDKKRKEDLRKNHILYEYFKESRPSTIEELLLDFLQNSGKYFNVSYSFNGTLYILSDILEDSINELLGEETNRIAYTDIFANLIAKKIKRVGKEYYIHKYLLVLAIEHKLESLKNEETQISEQSLLETNKMLQEKINEFLSGDKNANDTLAIFKLLTEYTDDEFSYQIDKIDSKARIILKNVPETLAVRYGHTLRYINMLRPVTTYKGYTIYEKPKQGKDGKPVYYFSRHILTDQSYGRKYTSKEDCINAIEKQISSNSISQQTLIELKTKRDRNVIYTPNKYIPGQVIKSLNITFNDLLLYYQEYDLIYNTGLYNANNLESAYTYIQSIIKEGTVSKDWLQNHLDTSEKIVTFLYILNRDFGEGVQHFITREECEKVVKEIDSLDYAYYLVEDVGNGHAPRQGFKIYYKTELEKGEIKRSARNVFKTTLIRIPPTEIGSLKIKVDEKTQRPLPMIMLLNDLKTKLEAKIGVKVNIETIDTLRNLFKEWNISMPENVRAFVYNGEVYINSSEANSSDVFHEFAHIALSVLKMINYENYQAVVNLVALTTLGDRKKTKLKDIYPNLADLDLNEEVFADLFASHLTGKNFDLFLDLQLEEMKKVANEAFLSIFGKEKIIDDLWGADLWTIFSYFGYDLGKLLLQGNGLELIQLASLYRLASAWIEDQIKYYNEHPEEGIGIEESCI